ncbi:MAG TPA: NAD(P)/FAD-dependent oxidoreductase [Gemmatimonadales bacterium]|nr:NAD(P)/FAD-dependent oxidoreductase [Gemmatimonadales bacterium]
MKRYDVVVVGGGVAGLAAAGRIVAAGRSVILLEARSRLGGRVHTVIDRSSGHAVELGAEFIQGNPKELLAIVRDAGLELLEIEEWHGRSHDGDPQPFPDVVGLVSRLLEGVEPDHDVPVADILRAQRARFTAGEIDAMTAYLQGFHGADLERFGSAALRENQAAEEVDDGHMYRIAGGYGQLVSHLAAPLESSLAEVRTGTVVTHLHWYPGTVDVEARSASSHLRFSADRAVIAVPLCSLKSRPEEEGTVNFDPLPVGWRSAFSGLEMGLAHRIDLRFETAWWMRQHQRPMFVHGKNEPFPVWWTGSPPDPPFLTGWVGGPRAHALTGQKIEQLIPLALRSVSSIFGVPAQTLAGWLRAAHSYDWTSDPFSRGAYSYGGVHAAAARKALRQPVKNTLFLCGEALMDGGRNATVPGALSSGLEAATLTLQTPWRPSGTNQ